MSEMTLGEIEAGRAKPTPGPRSGRDRSAYLEAVPTPSAIKRRLRARQVHLMRQAGKSCIEIGAALGVSASRARAIAAEGELHALEEAAGADPLRLAYWQRWLTEEGLAESEWEHRQGRQ
jgi:predicted O-methyltransferase YrrM